MFHGTRSAMNGDLVAGNQKLRDSVVVVNGVSDHII